jgi:hypothetical protein
MFGKKKDKKSEPSVPKSPDVPKPLNDIQKDSKKKMNSEMMQKWRIKHLTVRLKVQSNLTGQ